MIGGVKIVEYDIPLISIGWFWEAMDAHSSATHELSEVLLSAWSDFPFDVACYGSVLELNRLWVEPGQRTSGVWIPVVHELFRRVRRQTAIIIRWNTKASCRTAHRKGLLSRDGDAP